MIISHRARNDIRRIWPAAQVAGAEQELQRLASALAFETLGFGEVEVPGGLPLLRTRSARSVGDGHHHVFFIETGEGPLTLGVGASRQAIPVLDVVRRRTAVLRQFVVDPRALANPDVTREVAVDLAILSSWIDSNVGHARTRLDVAVLPRLDHLVVAKITVESAGLPGDHGFLVDCEVPRWGRRQWRVTFDRPVDDDLLGDLPGCVRSVTDGPRV